MKRSQLLEQLMDQMLATAHVMKSSIRIALPDRAHDLGRSEMELLMHLMEAASGLTTKDLANALRVTSSAITQSTDRLITKGFIEREQDPDDRRSVRITLRKSVRDSFAALKRQYKTQCQPIFDDLTDQEIQQLITLLSKIKGSKPQINPQNQARKSND